MTIDNVHMEADALLNRGSNIEYIVRKLLPDEKSKMLHGIVVRNSAFNNGIRVFVKVLHYIDGVCHVKVDSIEVLEYTPSYSVGTIVQRCLKLIMSMTESDNE